LPLTEHAAFHYELPATNSFYFLNPFLFSDLSTNPFTDAERISDIDFGASSASFVQINIRLAKNMQLEELPKNKEIYSADSSVVFMYKNDISNAMLSITSSLEIKKPIFDKQEYAALKKVFENIYSLLNNQVLLQKKEEK